MYCLPKIIRDYPKKYIIIVGWHGREYLYRHLADEMWEVKEEHMWLKEYSRAFHHISKNLLMVERSLKSKGLVIPSAVAGQYAIGNRCKKCQTFFDAKIKKCKCGSDDIEPSLFTSMLESKKQAVRIPIPTNIDVKKYLKDNPVGIFARGRQTYGRNLQPEFYVRLIELLEKMGYNPIWLGEKASTQPCPVPHVLDFSRMPEARNLETTLAIISNLRFTLQYWTASTRLASMVGTPYILFESPDQIYGSGQEGYRRYLCDFAPNKLIIAHYRSMYENNDKCLKLTEQAIRETEFFNFNDICDVGVTKMVTDGLKVQYDGRVYGSSSNIEKCLQ